MRYDRELMLFGEQPNHQPEVSEYAMTLLCDVKCIFKNLFIVIIIIIII